MEPFAIMGLVESCSMRRLDIRLAAWPFEVPFVQAFLLDVREGTREQWADLELKLQPCCCVPFLLPGGEGVQRT